MIINESVLSNSEKIIFALRGLYSKCRYAPYRMSKFEEYDLYADNKDFLVSDNVITFTDTDGKLLALKPDVTLSIIKNSIDKPTDTKKVFYNENVYRVSKGTNSYQEIMQAGLECFGKVGENEIVEVLTLAVDSLALLSKDAVLSVSDLDVLEKLLAKIGVGQEQKSAIFKAISEKNLPELANILKDNDSEFVSLLYDLVSLRGNINDILPQVKEYAKKVKGIFDNFISALEKLEKAGKGDFVCVDFSVVSDANYYNGIIFKGFVKGIPTAVLSGGQYDKLMKKMARKSKAIGFAVYTDALDRLDLDEKDADNDDFVNIALPKGRLGEKVYDHFARAGYECPSILEVNRKLIFENAEKKVRYFWVKPSDVAIYVERGAADVGVVGKDILLEYAPEVYEMLDLNMGKCRMAVAAPKDFVDNSFNTLRVATKFANIAKSYYQSKGRDIDIIHLNGSIEIAPILGLSDVIVDIVETGATLKENNLEVKETIVPISARLIANKANYKFKSAQIENIVTELDKIINKGN